MKYQRPPTDLRATPNMPGQYIPAGVLIDIERDGGALSFAVMVDAADARKFAVRLLKAAHEAERREREALHAETR